jgi:hypothetical protein
MTTLHNFLDSLFSNNGNSNASKKAKQRRRGRLCRIEELEGREMLSATVAGFEAFDSSLPQSDSVDYADHSGAENYLMPVKAAETAPTIRDVTATTTGMTVKWTKAEPTEGNKPSGYIIQCSTDAEFTNPISKRVNLAVTSTRITGLKAGTLYYVRVGADYPLDTSTDWSDAKSVKTVSFKPVKASVTAKNITLTQVTLSWKHNAKNAKYEVSGPGTHGNIELNDGKYSVTISGLAAGKSHKFVISSYNSDGVRVQVNKTVKTQTFTAVRSLKIDRSNSHKPTLSTLTLNWNVNQNIPETNAYEIKITNGLFGSRRSVLGTIKMSSTGEVIENGGFTITFIGLTHVNNNVVFKVKVGGLKAATRYGFEVAAMAGVNKSAVAKTSGITLRFPAVRSLKIDNSNPNKPTASTLTLNWNVDQNIPETNAYEIKITNGLLGNRRSVLGTIKIAADGTVIDKGGFDVTFVGLISVNRNTVFQVKIGGLKSLTRYGFEVTALAGSAKSAVAKTLGTTLKSKNVTPTDPTDPPITPVTPDPPITPDTP